MRHNSKESAVNNILPFRGRTPPEEESRESKLFDLEGFLQEIRSDPSLCVVEETEHSVVVDSNGIAFCALAFGESADRNRCGFVILQTRCILVPEDERAEEHSEFLAVINRFNARTVLGRAYLRRNCAILELDLRPNDGGSTDGAATLRAVRSAWEDLMKDFLAVIRASRFITP